MNLAAFSSGIAVAGSVPVTIMLIIAVTCLCYWLKRRNKQTNAEHALQDDPSVMKVTENAAYESIPTVKINYCV